jgi:hypothetical protein
VILHENIYFLFCLNHLKNSEIVKNTIVVHINKTEIIFAQIAICENVEKILISSSPAIALSWGVFGQVCRRFHRSVCIF